MSMKAFKIIFFTILFYLTSSVSWSADFQKGLAAYNKGEFVVAFNEFTLLAKQEHPSAIHYIGMMYRNGRGVKQNIETAIKWFTKGSELGNRESSYNMAIAYDQGMGNIIKNEKIAFKYYKLAAERGYADAQYNVGLRQVLGVGVEKNLMSAYLWLEICAFSDTFQISNDIKISSLSLSSRDKVESILKLLSQNMSASEIKIAKYNARKCFANNFKGC